MHFEQMELSDKETQEITRYTKSFGINWVNRSLTHAKAQKYLATYCELLKEKSSYGTPYNCCSTGYEIYHRKDGMPIHEDDLIALRAIDKGQENAVTLLQGGMEMSHKYLCDSSG